MWRRTTYRLIPLFLGIWTTSAPAQSMRGSELRVEIHGQDPVPVGYSMQLLDTTTRAVAGHADTDFFGGFSFRSVPAGVYLARLIDRSGNQVREDLIRFDGFTPLIQINLPGLPGRSRPTGERISLRQLQNPPSKNAIKAFLDALKYSEAGQYAKAAAALEKAVELSPAFADAHTNLGAQYLHLGRYEKAIEEAQRAMEIGSPNIHDLCNRGLGEWALGRPADAMRSAEQALRLDSRAITAHYIVGSLMALNPDMLTEAIRHLEIAAEKSPTAARNLEQARRLLPRM